MLALGFEPVTFQLTSPRQGIHYLLTEICNSLITLPELVVSSLGYHAKVPKTTTLVSCNITQNLYEQSSKCATASLTALSYQGHLFSRT